MKWFTKKPEEAIQKEDDEKDVEKKNGNEGADKKTTPALPSVSFFQLFR